MKEAYARSLTNEKIEDYAGAIKALSGVASAYPKGYTINLRLGWLYYLSGHYANSIDHYQAAQMAGPGALEPLQGMLLPLMAQTDYPRAEQIANRLLQMDPANYLGNLRLIEIFRHSGKEELALKTCLRMRERYPTDIRFLEQHGAILQAQNQTVEASGVYHTLQTLDPDNPAAALFFQPQLPNKGAEQ